jgi:uncharacterized protein
VSKLIFIVVVTVGLVLFFKYLAAKRDAPPKSGADKAPEDMVRCQTCGVNLPRSEALLSKGHFYCCDEHRRIDSD